MMQVISVVVRQGRCTLQRMRSLFLLGAILLLVFLAWYSNQSEFVLTRFSEWYERRRTDNTARSEGRSPTNIVFIKVHKTGSTTMSNILARYAINHDLNIALPEHTPETHPILFHCFGHFQEKRVMPLADGQRYNVLFNHMVYNRAALDNVMPSDTFYLAIMRRPQEMFMSAVYWFHMLKPPVLNNTENSKLAKFISMQSGNFRYFNRISFDTGLKIAHLTNKSAVQQHVQMLDGQLDLALITEHFHESLVLLKRRTSLDLRDIFYLRAKLRRSPNRHEITARDVAELRNRQMADHVIYDHFYAKFWTEARKEGKSFQREVADFTKTLSQFVEYCSSNRSQWDTFVVARSEWSEEFSFNARDCQLMALEERSFQELLLQRAKHRRARAGYREQRKSIPKWSPSPC